MIILMGDGAPGEPYSLAGRPHNSRALGPGAARVLSLSHPIIIIISYQNEEI